MLMQYLASVLLFLRLVHSVSNSSSVSYSTSTLEMTSFLTVTTPRPTGSGSAPSNAIGLEQASSCNQAKLDWIEDRGQAYVSNTTFQTSTSSVSYTIIRSGWIETFGPTEVYTLCDGYPRMNASTDFKTTETTPEQTIWSTFTTQSEVYRNVSAPTCTIGQLACSALDAEYSTSLTAYSNYASQPLSESVWPSVTSPASPICGSVTLPPEPSTTLAPAACVYNHATIQLLYWPVSTVGNHICGNEWTTVEATPTIEGKPNTAVGFNTTFTSPTVYMVLSGAYEVGDNYLTGTAINGILPMASDAVSSMCAGPGGAMGPPEAMDYADFDAPIPKSKYLCQPACWTKPDYPQSWTNSAYNITATENLCTTIYDGVYKPALQVPVAEFNSFYANFTNGVGLEFGDLQCSFSPGTDGIFYDPPSALQQVQSAPGPSAPNVSGATTTAAEDPRTTPAAPAPTVPTALPQTTGGDGDVPQPTRPSVPDPSGDGEEDGDGSPADSTPHPSNEEDGDGNASDPGEPAGNGDNGSGSGSDDSNDEGGQTGSDPSGGDGSPDDVGGIIASIIGAAPSPDSNPASQDGTSPSDSSNSDPTNSPTDQSQSGSSSDNDAAGVGTPPNDETSPSSGDASPDQGQPILLTGTDGDIVTANPSGSAMILPSATLTPGQQTSLAGVGLVSVGTDGIVQNGQTIPYPTPTPSVGESAYVVDGQTYTADGSSNVVVSPGQTLTAGGSAITIDGTTYSLAASSDGALLVNGATATQTDLGGGSASTSSGVMQQMGNAASGLSARSDGAKLSLALGLSGLLALL